jgi:hypothetical protein
MRGFGMVVWFTLSVAVILFAIWTGYGWGSK